MAKQNAEKSDDDFGRSDNKGAIVTIAGTTLNFTRAGDYTMEFNGAGHAKIRLDGGHTFNMKPGDFARITSLNLANPDARLPIDADVLGTDSVTGPGSIDITGVSFREADDAGTFEISHNLDNALGSLISTRGIVAALDQLTVNGSVEDAFKTLWDYLDDQYVAGANYYDIPLNETFVRLGVEYVNYLEAGGRPLTDVTAKFAADSNGNGIPQREQSMHDNLLGNLNDAAIQDRFSGDLEAELLALVPDEYGARPVYDGNEASVGGPKHDAVRAFDYDKGWDRPDYVDRAYDADIDARARDGDEMYYGDGNTIDDWNIVRHEGAGVELGLKVKHRGGDEYGESSIDADGVAHYMVTAGSQAGNANRAEWNFDFAATQLPSGDDQDFSYVLEVDLDPTEGVDFQVIFTSDAPGDTALGDGTTFQNSGNYAFYRSAVDIDDDAAGIQPYAFGEGEFNIRLSAFDADGDLIATNEIVVQVVEPTPAVDSAMLLL